MAQKWEEQPGLVDPKSWYEGYAEGVEAAAKVADGMPDLLKVDLGDGWYSPRNTTPKDVAERIRALKMIDQQGERDE